MNVNKAIAKMEQKSRNRSSKWNASVRKGWDHFTKFDGDIIGPSLRYKTNKRNIGGR